MFERIGRPDSQHVLHGTVYWYERVVRCTCDAISIRACNVATAIAIVGGIVFGKHRVMFWYEPVFNRSPKPAWITDYV